MKHLTKNKNWELNKEYNINKLLYLLVDRPNYINEYNNLYWKCDFGILSRKYNLPACVIDYGRKISWYNENYHCTRHIWI